MASRSCQVGVVRRRAVAGSASYGVAQLPGRRRTASRSCQVSVVRRRAVARSASYGVAQLPGRRRTASRSCQVSVVRRRAVARSAVVVLVLGGEGAEDVGAALADVAL